MVTREVMEKEDILKEYDITKSKLQYHISKKKDEFPKGKVNKHTRLKEYNAEDIAAYANKYGWPRRPLSLKQFAVETEPGLNALFGASMQDAPFDEEQEARDAVITALEEKLDRVNNKLSWSTTVNLFFISVGLVVAFVYILGLWKQIPL